MPVITVAALEAVQAGRKLASVKSTQGLYYKINPGLFGMFQVGNSYDVSVEEHPAQGSYKAWKEIKTVKPATQAQATSAGPGRQVPDAQAEVIFVTGGILRGIQSGQVNCNDTASLIDAGIALRTAFKEIWRQKAQNPQANAEMDDEIPF